MTSNKIFDIVHFKEIWALISSTNCGGIRRRGRVSLRRIPNLLDRRTEVVERCQRSGRNGPSHLGGPQSMLIEGRHYVRLHQFQVHGNGTDVNFGGGDQFPRCSPRYFCLELEINLFKIYLLNVAVESSKTESISNGIKSNN